MFDYVIIGGGAAGSVLAYRLSEDPKCRVLLVEAGPKDRHPFIHMPKGMGKIIDNPDLTWTFEARARPDANAPPRYWTRGKTLGGSTAINGMVYIRGQPRDYDDMAACTSADWSWSHIAPAYHAIEDHQLGEGDDRGVGGPLHVTLPAGDPLMDAYIAAGECMGLARQTDLNRPDDLPKIGYSPRTIFAGRRQSAAVAFLRRARHRSNLKVVTDMIVDRVLFEGRRAVGIAACKGSSTVEYRGANIILCAGTLGSPAILQRSGVGPGGLLAGLEIPMVAHSPEVGENLQEHLTLRHQWRLKAAASLNARLRGWRAIREGIYYYATRGGPLADGSFDVVAYFKTRPSAERPNALIAISPLSIDDTLPGRTPHAHHGFQAGAYLIRPRSKGHVRILSRDPRDTPRVVLDYLADAEDRRDIIDVFRFCRGLAQQGPLAPYVEAETGPGPGVETDDEIIDTYRARGGAGFHATGSCRMGSDEKAVVDPQGRVRGVEKLHVMDLSVPPFIISGGTQAPVMAFAWRFADMLQAEARGSAGGGHTCSCNMLV